MKKNLEYNQTCCILCPKLKTKQMKQIIIKLVFGERKVGEKISRPLILPKERPLRPLIVDEYNKWCEEFRVSSKVPKYRMIWLLGVV